MYFAKHTARVSIRPAAGSGRPKPLKSGIPRFHLQQREIQTSISKLKDIKGVCLMGSDVWRRWQLVAQNLPKWSPLPLPGGQHSGSGAVVGRGARSRSKNLQPSTWTWPLQPPAKLGCRMYSSGHQQIGQICILQLKSIHQMLVTCQ